MALEDLIWAGRCGALEAAVSFTGKRINGNTSSAPGFLTYAAQVVRNANSNCVKLSRLPVVVAEDASKRKRREIVADIATADTWNATAEPDAPTVEG